MGYTFFTDRDLGKQFPARLREAGLVVERHGDHFAADTPDAQWLAEVGRRRWIAITHDERIRYKTNDNHQRLAVAISSMWEQINVKTELFNAETPVHYDALRAGDFDVGRAGWLLDYSDPSNVLDLLKTGTMQDGKMNWGNNYGRFSNAEFDDLIGKAAAEPDLAVRAKELGDAEKIAMDNFAAFPLAYYLAANVVKPNIKGFEDNAKDVHRTRWLTKE